MAIPNTIRIPANFDWVFPAGAMCFGVDAQVDFERRGEADDQQRDKDTGERMWTVTVIDLDPEATLFGRSPDLKVKIAAPYMPVLPQAQIPGIRPFVEFEGLTLTPYTDSRKCKSEKCGARMAYSVRASGLIAPSVWPGQVQTPSLQE